MLNILKDKINSSTKRLFLIKKSNNNNIGVSIHNPPANKEWINSIYGYNKNNIKLLPAFDLVINNVIKSYFDLYSIDFEKKARIRRIKLKKRVHSSLRIFLSKAEIKHSNNKVVVTLYVYNIQKKYLENKLERRIKLKKSYSNIMAQIKQKCLNLIEQIKREKNFLSNTFRWNSFNYKNYENVEYSNIMKLLLKREISNIVLKQYILFNKSKFENTYISKLSYLLNKIYNKKIDFNIVNLKYIHLNSDIFFEYINMKLTKKVKKTRLSRVLKNSLKKIKLPSYNKFVISNLSEHSNSNLSVLNKLNNLNIKLLLYKNNDNSDILNNKIEELLKMNNLKSLNLQDNVLNSLKYKWVNGIRLEAKGRLNKRITASRSMFKSKYKGSLKNIDSSYKVLPSVMLRGHKRPNLQFTKFNSKNRNGSFGIKGWISSK